MKVRYAVVTLEDGTVYDPVKVVAAVPVIGTMSYEFMTLNDGIKQHTEEDIASIVYISKTVDIPE